MLPHSAWNRVLLIFPHKHACSQNALCALVSGDEMGRRQRCGMRPFASQYCFTLSVGAGSRVERLLAAVSTYDRNWPTAPVDESGLNGRFRTCIRSRRGTELPLSAGVFTLVRLICLRSSLDPHVQRQDTLTLHRPSSAISGPRDAPLRRPLQTDSRQWPALAELVLSTLSRPWPRRKGDDRNGNSRRSESIYTRRWALHKAVIPVVAFSCRRHREVRTARSRRWFIAILKDPPSKPNEVTSRMSPAPRQDAALSSRSSPSAVRRWPRWRRSQGRACP